MSLIWDTSIDRLHPNDPDEHEARIQKRKEVWEGEPDDPVLMERMYYAVEYIIEATKRNLSASPSGFIVGQGSTIYEMAELFYNHPERVPELKTAYESEKNPTVAIMHAINETLKEKAVQLFEAKTQKPFPNRIEWGSKAVINGIPVKVERLTPDGRIGLSAKGIENSMALYDFLGEATVSPEKLHDYKFSKERGDSCKLEFPIIGMKEVSIGNHRIRNILEERDIREEYERDWGQAYFELVRGMAHDETRTIVVTYDKPTDTLTLSLEE